MLAALLLELLHPPPQELVLLGLLPGVPRHEQHVPAVAPAKPSRREAAEGRTPTAAARQPREVRVEGARRLGVRSVAPRRVGGTHVTRATGSRFELGLNRGLTVCPSLTLLPGGVVAVGGVAGIRPGDGVGGRVGGKVSSRKGTLFYSVSIFAGSPDVRERLSKQGGFERGIARAGARKRRRAGRSPSGTILRHRDDAPTAGWSGSRGDQ